MRNLKVAIMLFTAFLVLSVIGIAIYLSFLSISQESYLVAQKLNFSNEFPLENETITITLTIANKGTAYQNAMVYFYANSKLIAEKKIFIGGETSKQISVEHEFLLGHYIIKAKIVPENIFIERTQYNKTIEKELQVFPSKVDLTPSNILFSTNTPTINQTIKITVIISNIGGINADNISYEIYNSTNLIANGKIDFIEGKNGRTEIEANYTVKNGGIHRTRVYVFTSLIEHNTSNNEMEKSVIVYSELPKEDFAILPENIFLEDAVEKYSTTIGAEVFNIGNNTANAKIKFYVDSSFIGEVEKEISQKGSEIAEVNWIPNSSKYYKISVNLSNDENKENNYAEREFYVKKMPDIVVENISIKGNKKEGEFANILVEIYNSGEGTANNFLVEIKSNGMTFYHERTTLNGNERKTISAIWQANAGINKISAIVNSDNLTMESTQENNVLTLTLEIEKKDDLALAFLGLGISAVIIFSIIILYIRKKRRAIFSVEEVFIIYKDGRLVFHKGRSSIDEQLISAMLTAIQEFIQQSFKAKGKIDEIQYGKERILIQHPPYDEYFSYVYLAVLINGREDADFKRDAMSLVVKIHKKYSEILKNWDGDLTKLKELDFMIEKFIKKFEKEN